MAAVYATMHPQDELAALFSRNLTLHPAPPPAPEPAPAPTQAADPQPQAEQKIVYISAHYHHSAHLANKSEPQSPPRPASEPSQSEVERVLREHGVDPLNLSPAQIQLFKTLDTPFQLRLVEIWRACPPPAPSGPNTDSLNPTTFEQEEGLARLRFEQQQQQLIDQQLQQEFFSGGNDSMMQDDETVLSLDGTPLTPTTMQASDGRWVGVGSPSSPSSSSYYCQSNQYSYMEPYMVEGYGEELMRREYHDQQGQKQLLEQERQARGNVDEPRAEAVPALQETLKAHADSAAPAGGSPNFNPAHADPVYRMMAERYGWFVATRDEEML
ncbi:hypothetical protein VTJ49DRAFT_6060 [Mycothermus thermophilus]|uniref:Uncharacterized protein n=1 Tax=Humicola insolens TaxID=85995 RepID=A0ABR3VJK8_HUMIN